MTTIYVSMTSGIRGPEGVLTQEQVDRAKELALQLTEKCEPTHQGLGDLHCTNYIVSWTDENSPIASVQVDAYGRVRLWRTDVTGWEFYVDTVGLWAYLAPFGYAAYRGWREAHEKAMKEYYEKVLPVSEQEKV